MIVEAIRRITAGQDLSSEQAGAAMDAVMSGDATPGQIGAFLIALRMKGETVDEIVGMVLSMRRHATIISAPSVAIDTCGTGGDGQGTFNVSTAAALVARGAGAVVAKHGNRAASSRCGSADVLEALGVNIALSPSEVERCIVDAGIGFMLAPTFHPAMRHAGPVRKEIGVRTIFNVLGPMANPALVKRQALGVAAPELAPKMIEVLARLGHEHAMVFHGNDGLDELTTTTTSLVYELRDGAISQYEVDPAAMGLELADSAALQGGDALRNAEIINALLDGAGGAARDIVVLNAAAALLIAGIAPDLAGGIELATNAIDVGGAREALNRLASVTNSVAA